MASEVLLPLLLCSGVLALGVAAAIVLLVVKEGSSASSAVYVDDIWKPCWSGVHPFWLLGFRSLACGYASAILVSDVISYGFGVFYFYTQWSFVLLIIYFATATLISGIASSRSRLSNTTSVGLEDNTASLLKGYGRDEEDTKSAIASLQMYWETIFAETEELAPFSGFLVQIVFQTVAGAAVLTDVVYFLGVLPVLTEIPRVYDFLEINLHGVNLLLLVGDMFLNRMSFPWFRGAYFTIWTGVYVLFQWSAHAFLGLQWWPYPFLNPTLTYAPVWYSMLLVGHVMCYGLMCSIVSLKHYVVKRFSSL